MKRPPPEQAMKRPFGKACSDKRNGGIENKKAGYFSTPKDQLRKLAPSVVIHSKPLVPEPLRQVTKLQPPGPKPAEEAKLKRFTGGIGVWD